MLGQCVLWRPSPPDLASFSVGNGAETDRHESILQIYAGDFSSLVLASFLACTLDSSFPRCVTIARARKQSAARRCYRCRVAYHVLPTRTLFWKRINVASFDLKLVHLVFRRMPTVQWSESFSVGWFPYLFAEGAVQRFLGYTVLGRGRGTNRERITSETIPKDLPTSKSEKHFRYLVGVLAMARHPGDITFSQERDPNMPATFSDYYVSVDREAHWEFVTVNVADELLKRTALMSPCSELQERCLSCWDCCFLVCDKRTWFCRCARFGPRCRWCFFQWCVPPERRYVRGTDEVQSYHHRHCADEQREFGVL